MFEITKAFRFEAAHQLPHLGDNHKCARMHGHNYYVAVILQADLLEQGMVEDYGVLSDTLGVWLKDTLDHRLLNDALVPFDLVAASMPTAEMLAKVIAHHIKLAYVWGSALYAVTVAETHDTTATYYL